MKKAIYIIILLLGVTGTGLFGQCYPDRHSVDYFDGWRSCAPSQSPNPVRGVSHWIQYELDVLMEIYQFHFWNINDPGTSKSGMQDYTIDYSTDGISWTEYGQFVLALGDGSSFYEGESGPDMGGIEAKFILITALTNFDVGDPCHGFAEIKVTASEAVVPLELVNFELECKGENTYIHWSVTNSLNQESMILERSSDAKNWDEVFAQNPSGLDQHKTYEYKYMDLGADYGTNYYRLKLIDFDGSYEYSDLLESNCKEPKIKMEVYPVPTVNMITVEFFTESGANVYYELSNAMGKIVLQGNQAIFDGESRFELDMSSLPVGTFMLSLSQESNWLRKKIIKIKD